MEPCSCLSIEEPSSACHAAFTRLRSPHHAQPALPCPGLTEWGLPQMALCPSVVTSASI